MPKDRSAVLSNVILNSKSLKINEYLPHPLLYSKSNYLWIKSSLGQFWKIPKLLQVKFILVFCAKPTPEFILRSLNMPIVTKTLSYPAYPSVAAIQASFPSKHYLRRSGLAWCGMVRQVGGSWMLLKDHENLINQRFSSSR